MRVVQAQATARYVTHVPGNAQGLLRRNAGGLAGVERKADRFWMYLPRSDRKRTIFHALR